MSIKHSCQRIIILATVDFWASSRILFWHFLQKTFSCFVLVVTTTQSTTAKVKHVKTYKHSCKLAIVGGKSQKDDGGREMTQWLIGEWLLLQLCCEEQLNGCVTSQIRKWDFQSESISNRGVSKGRRVASFFLMRNKLANYLKAPHRHSEHTNVETKCLLVLPTS